MNLSSPHSFHIPVMGLGFTIDTPVKVAKYGINSVISIIEDHLIENMREIISRKENLDYTKIKTQEYDSRAKRITAYLNLLDTLIKKQIEKIYFENFDSDADINLYFQMLPESSPAKKLYVELKICTDPNEKIRIEKTLRQCIVAGTIDVNIMTKLDKTNYDKNGNELPLGFSDALSALRGYAQSNLSSSIVFSAGMNPRLFSYCEKFADFFPDSKGIIKKKIILKVSDYRSALIQGKYLAKKGLWVSEFRIESGINCGGHTFVSNGILLGPILEIFKEKRNELQEELFAECQKALIQNDRMGFIENPVLKITAQGGIGTSEESRFLLDYYHLDSTGWGSPFLLVPEVTNVDEDTLKKLSVAKKEDYFLSHASPLGVPFFNFHHRSAEEQRKKRIEKNRAGSPCYKKFLASNTEFTERPICSASRQYQNLKLEQLKQSNADINIIDQELAEVLEKDCLCEGLGASALLVNHVTPSHKLSAVTICPGPNLAYFSGIFTLKQMVDHIYGRLNLLNQVKRPYFFVNELELYITYLKDELKKSISGMTAKKSDYFQTFKNNLLEGISYYESLFQNILQIEKLEKKNNLTLLESIKESLLQLSIKPAI
jgi:hypothetical protein